MNILLRKKKKMPAIIFLRQMKRISHDHFSVCLLKLWPKGTNVARFHLYDTKWVIFIGYVKDTNGF